MHLRDCAAYVSLISAVMTLAGCAYRLPTIAPPYRQPVRIVAAAPEQYTVPVNTGNVDEYAVPHDGRIVHEQSLRATQISPMDEAGYCRIPRSENRKINR